MGCGVCREDVEGVQEESVCNELEDGVDGFTERGNGGCVGGEESL